MVELVKAHCNTCGGNKNHIVLHQEKTEWREDVGDDGHWVGGEELYFLIKCAGCDAVHLKHESWFPEKDPTPEIFHYPPRLARRKPDWFHELFLNLSSESSMRSTTY